MPVPRQLEIVLNGPIFPPLLREDTMVMDGQGWYRTLTPSSPWATDDNEVLFSNLGEQDTEPQIEAIIDQYQQLGRPMRWCVYPWTQPADLGERLRRRGATRSDVRAFFCPTSLPLQLVENVTVERVDAEATAADGSNAYDTYIDVMAAGEMSSGLTLPADEVAFRRRRYRELIHGPEAVMQLFLARYRGAVAGCGALYVKGDHGYLTGDYVIRDYEGHGIFQSLIAARLQWLHRRGIPLACGHAREQTSAPWVERFGFRPVYAYRIYRIDPPDTNRQAV